MVSTKLRHVVLFGFKQGAGKSEVDELVARFRALHGLVPGIEAFEWGTNISPEGLSHGHSHASPSPSPARRRATPISCIPNTRPSRIGPAG